MADPGFDGKEHFLGTLSGAGFVHTPNAAPDTFAPRSPFGEMSGDYHGQVGDTGVPVGQSQVGFHGVAAHGMEMNTRQCAGDCPGMM